MRQLTGARARDLMARARRALTWQEVVWADCLPIDDWRKARAIRNGTTVEWRDLG